MADETEKAATRRAKYREDQVRRNKLYAEMLTKAGFKATAGEPLDEVLGSPEVRVVISDMDADKAHALKKKLEKAKVPSGLSELFTPSDDGDIDRKKAVTVAFSHELSWEDEQKKANRLRKVLGLKEEALIGEKAPATKEIVDRMSKALGVRLILKEETYKYSTGRTEQRKIATLNIGSEQEAKKIAERLSDILSDPFPEDKAKSEAAKVEYSQISIVPSGKEVKFKLDYFKDAEKFEKGSSEKIVQKFERIAPEMKKVILRALPAKSKESGRLIDPDAIRQQVARIENQLGITLNESHAEPALPLLKQTPLNRQARETTGRTG